MNPDHAALWLMLACMTALCVFLAVQVRGLALAEPSEPALLCEQMAAGHERIVVYGYSGNESTIRHWRK